MSGWLIDINVISVFLTGRPTPSPRLAAWFGRHTNALYLPTIAAMEIESGIAERRRAGADRQADELAIWFAQILTQYGDRILPFDLALARLAGALDDQAWAEGRHPGLADIAIAATALAHGLVLLTRNLRHFQPLGVEALDPFEMG